MRIGVDIDDTLCEFIQPLNDYYNTTCGANHKIADYTSTDFSKVWGKTNEECQKHILDYIFSNECTDLCPMKNSFNILKSLRKFGFKFYAISGRDSRLETSTREWLSKNYPGIFEDVILCNQFGPKGSIKKCKVEECKKLNIDIFIDDRPNNFIKDESLLERIEDLLSFTSTTTTSNTNVKLIVYDQPWNRNYNNTRVHNWSDIYNLLTFANRRVLIGVSGKLGSGKDTIYHLLSKRFHTFQRRAFADRVKETVAALTHTSLEMQYTREGKAYVPPGFRESLGRLQQIVGENMKLCIRDDVWCNVVIEDPDLPPHVVITDCRFPIKVEAIEKKGGIVIRLEGDPVGIRKDNVDGRDLNHISETALDDYEFKYIVKNNSTMEELEENIMRVISNII